MIVTTEKTIRRAGVVAAALAANLLLFGPAMVQGSGQKGSEANVSCEFYFYPAQAGAEIRAGSPLPGRIKVSPDCRFFRFPKKSEQQLVGDPALNELTGSQSHFRITPDGDLLFMLESGGQKDQAAGAVETHGDESVRAAAQANQQVGRPIEDQSRTNREISALEARLGETLAALEQAKTGEARAHQQIAELEQALMQVKAAASEEQEGRQQALSRSFEDNERLRKALQQAQVDRKEALNQTATLKAERKQTALQADQLVQQLQLALSVAGKEVRERQASLDQSVAKSAKQQEQMNGLVSTANSEIERLSVGLAETQATQEQARERIAQLEAELSGMTEVSELKEKLETENHRLAQALLQSRDDKQQVDSVLAQAQTAERQAHERIGALEAELGLVKEAAGVESVRLERALLQSQAEGEHLEAELAALAQQASADRQAWSETRQSLLAAEETLAGVRAQAGEDAKTANERLEQADERIALLEKAVEQVRSESGQQATGFEAEITGLKQENVALAPWEGRYRVCVAESVSCAASLTDMDEQANRLTRELGSTKQQLQGLVGDTDGDGVANARDQCTGTPANLATDSTGCVSIDLRGVEFASGSDRLRPTSKQVLNSMARLLKAVNFVVEVQGHTDSSGTPEGNQRLSRKRAQAVVDYLIKQGVPAKALSAKGYGDTRPIVDNDTAEGRSRNRRVEIARQR